MGLTELLRGEARLLFPTKIAQENKTLFFNLTPTQWGEVSFLLLSVLQLLMTPFGIGAADMFCLSRPS